MKIIIKTIPHKKQDYDTIGNWKIKKDCIEIYVSNLLNWKYECLIAIHEFVEAVLCKDRGITAKTVDKFDMSFKGEGEPGDAPNCPYKKEHFFAEIIERLLAKELNINWKKYERSLFKL